MLLRQKTLPLWPLHTVWMYTWQSVDGSMRKDASVHRRSQLCDYVLPALHISTPVFLHYVGNRKYRWRDRRCSPSFLEGVPFVLMSSATPQILSNHRLIFPQDEPMPPGTQAPEFRFLLTHDIWQPSTS